jgi:arginase
MTTRYFALPYDSGYERQRMGNGPARIARELGIETEEILSERQFRTEASTAFELYRKLADEVHEAVALGDFPVVLSGNCGAAIGTAAGVGCDDLAAVWFDAHGDYNTPDTTDSGFLDGMAMAVLNGRCWKALAASIPRFAPLVPARTMHVGARDYSPGERDALLYDGVWLVEPLHLKETTVAPMFDAMHAGAGRILVHLDLDVIDPKYGVANGYACAGGLSPDDVVRVIDIAAKRFQIAALVLASYDPSVDREGRIAEIAARVVRRVVASS